MKPDDRSSQINRTQKVLRTLIVAGRERSILLEFGKEIRGLDGVLGTSICHPPEG